MMMLLQGTHYRQFNDAHLCRVLAELKHRIAILVNLHMKESKTVTARTSI